MAKVVVDLETLKAPDYRQFLRAVLRSGREVIPRGYLSKLARKSGLPRSFLTELLQGKKGLTLRSFSKLQSALKLPADWNRYFTLLVASESREFRESHLGLSEEDVKTRLHQLRQRILQKTGLEIASQAIGEARVLSLEVFCVYAALGSLENGASFSQILRKTNLGVPKVQRSLNSMMSAGWVRKNDDRFFATDRAIDFQDLGTDLGFVQAFAESSSEMSSTAKKISSEKENLIFFSVVPISPNRVLEFKDRVRSALLDLVDEFQDDDGAVIKKITLGIY